LRSEPSRSSLYDFAFRAQLLELATQALALLTFFSAQANILWAGIVIGPSNPPSERLHRALEFASEVARRVSASHELDDLLPEFLTDRDAFSP
jgi:hypothetical protein